MHWGQLVSYNWSSTGWHCLALFTSIHKTQHSTSITTSNILCSLKYTPHSTKGKGIDTIHINAHHSFMNSLITCLTHYTILPSKHWLTIQQMSHTWHHTALYIWNSPWWALDSVDNSHHKPLDSSTSTVNCRLSSLPSIIHTLHHCSTYHRDTTIVTTPYLSAYTITQRWTVFPRHSIHNLLHGFLIMQHVLAY